MFCPDCKQPTDGAQTCPDCGASLSVTGDRLDALIQAASVPNLAALFRAGKKRGHISSVDHYADMWKHRRKAEPEPPSF